MYLLLALISSLQSPGCTAKRGISGTLSPLIYSTVVTKNQTYQIFFDQIQI